jgi:hypothetical protein
MDLDYTPEEQAFREEVRAFVRANLPQDIAEKVLHHRRLVKDDYVRWQKILYKKGWIAGHWPREHGGQGWTPVQTHIFDEECAAAGSPRLIPFGLNMVAPVIMAFGSRWQKEHYLPRILSQEHWWCQGYSEPGSGSDLASLKTRAVREDDHYLVNGQKTWTTMAHWADMIFCLVRTDPTVKKQEGISFLLINMHSPGITVRPLVTIDEEHEVNEVFFDNVKVPHENLREVPARPRAHRHHRRRRLQTRADAAQGVRRDADEGREAARRGPDLPREDRAGRDRPARARDDAAPRALQPRQARPGGVDPQDQGHRGAAGADRADDGGARPVRRAVLAGRDRARCEGHRVRSRSCRPDRGALLRLAQDVDLRRVERDPAQHHRADGPGALERENRCRRQRFS